MIKKRAIAAWSPVGVVEALVVDEHARRLARRLNTEQSLWRGVLTMRALWHAVVPAFVQ